MLLGSDHIEDLLKRETRIKGHFEPWRMARVNAQPIIGVRIGGKGRLNGNGRLINVVSWTQFFDLIGLPAPSCRGNDVTIRDVTGDMLQDIALENIDVKFTGTPGGNDRLTLGTAENLVLKNVTVNGTLPRHRARDAEAGRALREGRLSAPIPKDRFTSPDRQPAGWRVRGRRR